MAGYALFRRARKTRRGGRVTRLKIRTNGAGEFFGAIVCFVAAYLCLLNSTAHTW